ncbi:MAG: hypothetical protein HQL96_10810 [Magnetococcales bacterium]|nr:hypothetical protein [Magnetococcales bacterium]
MPSDARLPPAAPWRWTLLALAALVAWRLVTAPHAATLEDYPRAPAPAALRLTTLGDPQAGALFWMLWLQTFDDQAGITASFKKMDFARLADWLERLLALDPASEYPLLMATRVYGAVLDPARQRLMIDFVGRAFREAPERRWQWQALAAMQARHGLDDRKLALALVTELEQRVPARQLPFWVRGLHVIMLREGNEIEAARHLMALVAQDDGLSERQRQAVEMWRERLEERH